MEEYGIFAIEVDRVTTTGEYVWVIYTTDGPTEFVARSESPYATEDAARVAGREALNELVLEISKEQTRN